MRDPSSYTVLGKLTVNDSIQGKCLQRTPLSCLRVHATDNVEINFNESTMEKNLRQIMLQDLKTF
jgi:hypothetical protein